MMNDNQQEERRVFTAALAMETPGERDRYLDEECRGKRGLRERVEALLKAHDQAGGFLGATVQVSKSRGFLQEEVGQMIGRYKLLQEIGEGGFGRVFMAEQTQPVHRKVALKIIKAGMDTKEVVARFEAERQALALMDHPNIARVFDGGATQTGRPYFVMELVKGIPITDYCDGHNLPMADRLRLFMQVCHAVQHAHQKGIIHRDLKPSNIMITMIDGEPVPKIIDFGVAKALGQQLTEKTLFTAFEMVIGTPAYMSPEQTVLSGVDVDTRSDIYSLGVLLYELLTGVTPFDADTLRKAGLDEFRRMVRESEPPRPSMRLRGLGEKLTEVAQHHHVDPSSLTRLVHGDLDWIVMKALEKDRARRYESADALLADLQRHLDHQPVLASPPGMGYRARKYIRRHRMGVALGGSVTLALIVGLVAALLGFRQARQERDRAVAAEQQAGRERDRAEGLATENHRRLVERYVSEGNRLVEQGDLFNALLPFATALKEDRDDAARADLHRLRLAATLKRCPKLVFACFHGNNVAQAEFSPDGSRILTASRDHTARVWDAVSGDPVTPPLEHSGEVVTARFSPDGKWVVTASRDETARIWNAATGERRGRTLAHPDRVASAVFSPDGRWIVTACLDGAARVWDATTGEQHGKDLEHRGSMRGARFSPEGGRILVTSHNLTRVWSFVPGRDVELLWETLQTTASHLGPKGSRVLIAGRGNAVMVRDVADGRRLVTLRFTGERPQFVFSPDGERMAIASFAGGDGLVQIWDPETGEMAAPPLTHPGSGPMRALAFSPDHRRLLTATDETVRIWDLDSGHLAFPPLTHGGVVLSASFSSDGRQVLTASMDGSARIWNLAGDELARPPVKHPGLVHKILFHPDNRRVMTLSVDGTARFWHIETSEPVVLPDANFAGTTDAAFSPDGRLLAVAGEDGKIGVWDLSTGQPAGPVLAHEGRANHVDFSPDGGRLVTAGADGMVRVWRVGTGERITGMSHPGPVRFASFTPDGSRIVAGLVNTPEQLLAGFRTVFDWPRQAPVAHAAEIRCWDAATGEIEGAPIDFGISVTQFTLSPDRRHVITGCSRGGTPGRVGYTNVWDLSDGTASSARLSHQGTLLRGAFSPDGKRVVTCGRDGTTRVWDVATGEMLTTPMHGGAVDCTFSPDGRLVATASGSNPEVRLWDAEAGQLLGPPLRVRPGGVLNRLAFSLDGRFLVVATSDNHAQAVGTGVVSRPLEDELLLVQMLAGRSLDEMDVDQTLVLSRLKDAWETLHARYPEEFGVTREQQLAWLNRQRAQRSTRIHSLMVEGELSEVETVFRDELAERKRVLGDAHPGTASTLAELAEVLQGENKLGEAEVLFREALEIQRKVPGGHGRDLANSVVALASVLEARDKWAEVEVLRREVLDLEKALSGESDPAVAGALSDLGRALVHEGKFAEAETVRREALAMRRDTLDDPHADIADSLADLAVVQWIQGRSEEAEALHHEEMAMRRAILAEKAKSGAYDDLNAIAWLLATCDDASLRDGARAVAYAEEAVERTSRKQSGMLRTLAAAYAEEGRFADAVNAQREAIALIENLEAKAYYRYWIRLYKAGEPYREGSFDALILIGDVLRKRQPARAEALDRLALSLVRERLGRLHRSVVLFLNRLGIVLEDQGRKSEAEAMHREALEMWRELSPDDLNNQTVLSRNLGRVLRQQGKLVEAAATYIEALGQREAWSGGEDAGLTAALADVYARMGDFDKALEAYSKVVALSPADTASLYRCALLHLSRGDAKAYRAIGERVVELVDELRSNSRLKEALWTCTFGPDAVADFQPLLEAAALAHEQQGENGPSAFLLQVTGSLAYRAGDDSEAVEQLTESERKKEDNAVVCYVLAMAHARLGQLDEAAGWFQHASRTDSLVNGNPGGESLLWNRRLIAELLRREAIEILGRRLPMEPEIARFEAWRECSREITRLTTRGKPDELRSYLAEAWNSDRREAIQSDPEMAPMLATLHGRLGYWADAMDQYQRMTQDDPEEHWNWFVAHVAAVSSGRTEIAGELGREMLSRFGNSQSASVCERVAKSVLLTSGGSSEVERAAELAERACKQDSASPWNQMTKGMAHYRLGSLTEAAASLEPASKAPDSHVACLARYFLAMSLHRQGKTDEAEKELTAANQLVDEDLRAGDLGLYWHDVCINLVARAEAERLIRGRVTSAPVTPDTLAAAFQAREEVGRLLSEGYSHGKAGEWQQSATAYAAALRHPAFLWDQDRAASELQCLDLQMGTAFAKAGDRDGHERLCRFVLRRELEGPGEPDLTQANRFARLCFLDGPSMPADLQERGLAMERFVTAHRATDDLDYWTSQTCGIVECDAGDAERAMELLTRAEQSPEVGCWGAAMVYRAMVLKKLNRDDEAAALLYEAERALAGPLKSGKGGVWWDLEFCAMALERAREEIAAPAQP